MKDRIRLIQFLQAHQTIIEEGGRRAPKLGQPPNEKQALAADLARVQKTNEIYFSIYWATLIAAFIGTLVLAIVFRQEMGGLATVLGAGGILQGGLLLRLSAEWKEKARVDIVAVLSQNLTPEQLQPVLKELLAGLRN